MNKTTTRANCAMAITAVITLGFGAINASVAGPSDQFVSDGVNKYIVRFPDLDLSKIAGAKTLYSRISLAARIVCRPLEGGDLQRAEQHQACVDQAVAGAVANVNRPLLSQYHQLRVKGDKAGLVQLAQAN
jgi:UrcA family protein